MVYLKRVGNYNTFVNIINLVTYGDFSLQRWMKVLQTEKNALHR